jgi:hypothetical protein
MNNNRSQFIKLWLWGTGLQLPLVVIVLTLLLIFTSRVHAVDPILPSPVIKTCASYGFTCTSGYSCSLNTTSLGSPSIGPYFKPKYSCTTSSSTYESGCLKGWGNIGGTYSEGEYRCKATTGLCKTPGTFPWPAPSGGYYCLSTTYSPQP